MARTGRRPGGPDTKAAILSAARAEFGAKGYHQATIRGIAAAAAVDPALVHHYFGTKEDLFGASIDLPIRASDVAEAIIGGGIDSAGKSITNLFFTIWENPQTRDPLLALLRGAFTTEQGADVLREFFGSAMLARIAPLLGLPDAEVRVSLAVSHLLGVAVLRYVVAFPALSRVPVEDLIEIIAPRIQAYLSDPAT